MVLLQLEKPQPVVRFGKIGIYLDRPPVFALGLRELPQVEIAVAGRLGA
jgi:hypothetical protein